MFNGGPRSRWFSRDSAYILQDDLHIPTLTVRETIYFAACCKLREGTSKEAINQRVQELLEITGLHVVQDTIVGDPSRKGISGGQLKRLSIAVEIVSLPKTIFLDEPTSGLDSTIAMDVMAAIRRIADQNRTCISTIHQPSTAVYEMFDTIVLLCHGHLIYFGPAKEVVQHFTNGPLAYYYIPGQNPAEFILEVSEGVITPIDTTNTNGNGMTNIVPTQEQFVKKYTDSVYYTAPILTSATPIDPAVQVVHNYQSGRLHATTKWTQFKMLLWRDGLSILRDVDAFYAMLGKSVVVGLLIGVVFYRQGVTTLPLFDPYGVPYAEVQNISALLFFGMMHSMITNVEAIPHICSKNNIFRREVDSFAYSVSPYWLTAMISHLPLQFVGYVIFVTITFFLCRFKQTFDYFIYYAIAVFLANVCSYNFALLLGATVKREGSALVAFPLIFLFFSTFAGYPILIPDVPPFWSWAPTINFVRWCYQGLMVNQWYDYDHDPNANGSVLALYDFQNWNKYASYGILLAMFALTSTLAYVAMRPPARQLNWFPSSEEMGMKYRRRRGGGRGGGGDDDADGGGRVYRFSSFLENSLGLPFSYSFSFTSPSQDPPTMTRHHQSEAKLRLEAEAEANDDDVLRVVSEKKSAVNPLHLPLRLTSSRGKASTTTPSPLTDALLDAAASATDQGSRSNPMRSTSLASSSYVPPSAAAASDVLPRTTTSELSGYVPPQNSIQNPSFSASTTTITPRNTNDPSLKASTMSLRQHSRRRLVPSSSKSLHGNSGGTANSNGQGDDNGGGVVGFALTFRDLYYHVPVTGPTGGASTASPSTSPTKPTTTTTTTTPAAAVSSLTILKGVSGCTKPGEICALMGSSGAGKTTLLDILAYRKTIGDIRGTIAINGRTIETAEAKQLLKQVTAYVMQENVLIGALTVREHLYYAARLRLSYSEFHGDVGIQQRVDDLLTMLGLTHVQHSKVGSEGDRGISGGQKKRVSIGVEIIHFPEIIFLDEPTTGLDSAISFEVMSTVRLLADQQRTVICTIHQPSPATYALFNTLLLLSEGQVLYFGPAADAVGYFSTTCPYRFPYLMGSNPAEYVIAVASGAIAPTIVGENQEEDGVTSALDEEAGGGDGVSRSSRRTKSPLLIGAGGSGGGGIGGIGGKVVTAAELAGFYLTTLYAERLQEELQSPIGTSAAAAPSSTITTVNWEDIARTSHVNTVWSQVPVLMSRMFLVKRREYHQLALSLVKSIVISVFYGTIFYHLPTGTDPNVYLNRISIVFFSLISILMSHQADIPDILEQRLLFNRERASQTISVTSYWLAKFLLDAPFNAVFVLIYSGILYTLCSLRAGSKHFWFFYYILWVTDFVAYFAAQFVANISPSSEVAMSLFPVLMFFALAFEGFIIYVPEFPVWSHWATYVSYLRYAYQALILNEFDGNTDLPFSALYIDELGFSTIPQANCAGYMWIFVFGHALVAYLVLKHVNFIKR